MMPPQYSGLASRGVAGFLWLRGPGFREPGRRKWSRGRAQVGVTPQKRNLSFRFMKRRKLYFAYGALHVHELVFPVCVMHFKTK